jgi:hypothetical protein
MWVGGLLCYDARHGDIMAIQSKFFVVLWCDNGNSIEVFVVLFSVQFLISGVQRATSTA